MRACCAVTASLARSGEASRDHISDRDPAYRSTVPSRERSTMSIGAGDAPAGEVGRVRDDLGPDPGGAEAELERPGRELRAVLDHRDRRHDAAGGRRPQLGHQRVERVGGEPAVPERGRRERVRVDREHGDVVGLVGDLAVQVADDERADGVGGRGAADRVDRLHGRGAAVDQPGLGVEGVLGGLGERGRVDEHRDRERGGGEQDHADHPGGGDPAGGQVPGRGQPAGGPAEPGQQQREQPHDQHRGAGQEQQRERDDEQVDLGDAGVEGDRVAAAQPQPAAGRGGEHQQLPGHHRDPAAAGADRPLGRGPADAARRPGRAARARRPARPAR